MVNYELFFTKRAQKDALKLAESNLKEKAKELLVIISEDPLKYPPDFEYLKGDLEGTISRRINKQHRLVYEVFEEEKKIKILSMWTHYE